LPIGSERSSRVASGFAATLLLASGAAAAGDQASASTSARSLWARCAERLGVAVEQAVRTRRFGETPEMTRRILPLVLSGEKTITTTSPWLYEHDPAAKPVEGSFSVVVDEAGIARAVLRTTAVKTVTFDAVTEEDSRYEGIPVRPIEAWREVHVRFFARKLAPLGKAPDADMPVTLERFEVVCRPEYGRQGANR
jgi:uncharacterized protein YhfF